MEHTVYEFCVVFGSRQQQNTKNSGNFINWLVLYVIDLDFIIIIIYIQLEFILNSWQMLILI